MCRSAVSHLRTAGPKDWMKVEASSACPVLCSPPPPFTLALRLEKYKVALLCNGCHFRGMDIMHFFLRAKGRLVIIPCIHYGFWPVSKLQILNMAVLQAILDPEHHNSHHL